MRFTIAILYLLFMVSSNVFSQTADINVSSEDFYELMQTTNDIYKNKKVVKQIDKMRRAQVSKKISKQIMQYDTIQVVRNPSWIDYIIGSFQEYVLTDSVSYLLQIPGELTDNEENEFFSEMIIKIRNKDYVVGESCLPEIFGSSEYYYYYKFVRQPDNHFVCYKEKFFHHPLTSVLYKI